MENINWFPGHMKKTRDLLRDNLKLIDVVIEILDSRIPISSKNPEIDKIIDGKAKVVVLNKLDLSDPAKTEQWKKHFKDNGIRAIFLDSIKGVGIEALISECRLAASEKMSHLASRGRNERAIRVMIVGIPNVGKSSLINKLSGKKSAKVGNRPGVTRGKQWVKLKGDLEMLDTPGILWPKFEDQSVALNLAFTGAIKDEILDSETVALRLIEKLSQIEPEKLKTRFALEELGETPLETMDAIGRKRGCIISKSEIDYERVAGIILHEFRSAKIGRITLETPDDLQTIEKD